MRNIIPALFCLLAASCQASKANQLSIYGGETVAISNAIAKSTIGLYTRNEFAGEQPYATIDGSATLIGPQIAVGAAHTCLKFKPKFALAGPSTVMNSQDHRRITRCIPHPKYQVNVMGEDDYNIKTSYDIALFILDRPLPKTAPVPIIASTAQLPKDITIAGFGSYEGQFDFEFDEVNREWTNFRPYSLRAVQSIIGAEWAEVGHFQDGPNPGHGSCQGDSGGSVYATVQGQLTLIGMPIAGPGCPDGIGYNLDLRSYVAWIGEQVAVIKP